jgi:hypothetical protein
LVCTPSHEVTIFAWCVNISEGSFGWVSSCSFQILGSRYNRSNIRAELRRMKAGNKKA